MKFIIDTDAWIEYFLGSSSGKKVEKIIEADDNSIFSSAITVAEITSIICRRNDDLELLATVEDYSAIVGITKGIAKKAGRIHADMRKSIKNFGMADSIILATAKEVNGKVVTGDKHFKGLKDVILI